MFRKIELYVDGRYYCSTQMHRTLHRAKESLTQAHFVAGKGWQDGVDIKRIRAAFAD